MYKIDLSLNLNVSILEYFTVREKKDRAYRFRIEEI